MRFKTRDLLMVTALVAVHVALLRCYLGSETEILPGGYWAWAGFLPLAAVGVILALIFRALPRDPVFVVFYRPDWTAVWVMLLIVHFFVYNEQAAGDLWPGITVVSHNVVGVVMMLAIARSSVAVYPTGVWSSCCFHDWDQLGASVASDRGSWWLLVASTEAMGTWSTRLPIPEVHVEQVCAILAEKQTEEPPTNADSHR